MNHFEIFREKFGCDLDPKFQFNGKPYRGVKRSRFFAYGHVADGKEIFIFGDFGEDDTGKTVHVYCDGQEKGAEYKKEVEKIQKKIKDDNQKKYKKNKDVLDWVMKKGLPLNCQYLSEKNIRETGNVFCDEGNNLVIPMTIEGELVGFQKITGAGDKYFMKTKDVKLKGNHFVFGDVEDSQQIYICEGYADGSTIYEATKTPVVVAFNCANLPAVANQFKTKQIIFACDNDENNQSVKHAKRYKGRKLISIPEDVKDFNDMASAHGVDAVKKKLLPLKKCFYNVNVLGKTHDVKFLVTSDYVRQIVRLPHNMTKAHLTTIAPMEYWVGMYGIYDDNGKLKSVSYDRAINDIKMEGNEKGIFDPSLICGTGVFKDNCVNTGDEIIGEPRDRFLFVQGRKIPKPVEEFPSKQEINDFLELLLSLSWEDPRAGVILLGWCSLATVCGGLDWRPHAWITGPDCSGKSWIKTNIINKILQDFAIFPLSNSTEAGIRRRTFYDSTAIVFDEFEIQKNKFSQENRQRVLEYARANSIYDAKSEVLKGNEDFPYKTSNIFLFSSIRTMLEERSDKGRFVVLRSCEGTKKQFENVLEKYAKIDFDNLSKKIFNLMFFNLEKVNKGYSENCKSITMERMGHSYKTMSMIKSALEILGVEEYLGKDKDLEDFFDFQVDAHSDEEECFDHLISKTFILDKEETSLSSLCRPATFDPSIPTNMAFETISKSLENKLIKVIDRNTGKIAIAKNNHILDEIFKGTLWEGKRYIQSLRRHPNFRVSNKRERFNGIRKSCFEITLPLE